jgi:nucleoside-diphosphate-sugar epimerase
VRNPSKAKKILVNYEKLELLEGSVEDVQALDKAFDRVEVFYNCVNLPYQQWNMLPAMHERILDAAAKVRARMVFPGNVYIYGHIQTATVNENHPRNPCSKKGRIRLELENNFMRRSQEGMVPTVIMRFPDYYGPNAESIVDGIFRSALHNKKAHWYGKLDVMHEFIFIADAAKAMIMASERQDATSHDFNVPGPKPIRVRDWITLVYKEVGFPQRMTGTSHLFVRIAGLFNSLAREFAEMQYLAEEPLILDGSKFNNFFHTHYPTRSYEEGIRETVNWLRAIP